MSSGSLADEKETRDVLLSMYDQHRQEIRAHGKRKTRRYLGSLTVLGLIIGYVFTSNGDARILVLAPYVLGFLYVSHISSMHYVAQLAALSALIEAELDCPGAEYEFYHGGFSITHNPRFEAVADFEDIDEFESIDTEKDPRQLHENVRTYVRWVMRVVAISAYLVIGVWGAIRVATTEIPSLGTFASTGPIVAGGLIFLSQVGILIGIFLAWRAYRDYKEVLRAGVWNDTQGGGEAKIGTMDASSLTDRTAASDDYSIWLIPDRDSNAYQQLEEKIEEYAQLYEDAPEFEPHITVLGGGEGERARLKDEVERLAQEQPPFDVTFPDVHCSTTRHQCVFLLVEPTVELFSLHRDAARVFDVDAGMYVPHLSLIYADISIEERLEMAESLDATSLPRTAHINEIALVKTTGPVSEWETVATYEFQ